MVKTAQLGLPLVLAAQAQKHVTVNEALSKLDAFAQLRFASMRLSRPPEWPMPGQSYVVAGEGRGDWVNQTGRIATYVNEGWTFTDPLIGWKAWDEESETWTVFDGTEWQTAGLSLSSCGAGAGLTTHEFDHIIFAGAANSTDYVLPANSIVFGVTGRVISEIKGGELQSWCLGVQGSEGRYGSGLGLSQNSYILGLTGVPMSYYEPTPLLLSTEGGEFVSGFVRLAVTYMSLFVPRSV